MTLTEIADKYRSDKRSDGHNYVALYEQYFESIRHDIETVLEIGIGDDPQAQGHSLKIWEEYFDKSLIVGCDYNTRLVDEIYGNRIVTEFIDQRNIKSIEDIAKVYQPDIIIDDGSHENGDIIRTFEVLFPSLKDNGIYVVEDVYHSYDRPNEYTFIQYCHNIIDEINHKQSKVDNKFGISGIHFYNEIVFIFKGETVTR